MVDAELDRLRELAVGGDKSALDALIGRLIDDVYRVASRMVWDRQEAEDATQEILTKVVTKLDSFEGRSSLKTWVHRIAVNHLLDRKRNWYEELTFDALALDLLDGLEDPHPEHQPELEALAREVMVTCTGAMLLCLDREHRIAYLLGDVLQMPGPVAAEIIGIEAPLFRKRLQRARSDIRSFMKANCGQAAASAPCRCTRRVNRAIELGRIDPSSGGQREQAERAVEEIGAMLGVEGAMRAALEPAPDEALDRWRVLLEQSSALLGER
jgi:RNA polymerase sigma factor (sigma-70 family)